MKRKKQGALRIGVRVKEGKKLVPMSSSKTARRFQRMPLRKVFSHKTKAPAVYLVGTRKGKIVKKRRL